MLKIFKLCAYTLTHLNTKAKYYEYVNMHINNQLDFRKEGGLSIVKLGIILQNEDKSFTDPSQTFVDKKYTVVLLKNVLGVFMSRL